jgi:hypothetical protein
MRRFSYIALFVLFVCWVPGLGFDGHLTTKTSQSNNAANTSWQSPARMHHLITKTSGMLLINDHGVEFRPKKGSPLKWSYVEIQSFHMTAHRLNLETYQNRSWHFPGDREFHFSLTTAVPPAVAEQFARRVGKPAVNGRPNPSVSGFASLAARHRTFGGGTNGVLHFRKGGIDYVTHGGRSSRSWRWSDIQTIANPDPWHFSVQGYRETYDFELKQTMSQKLFDQLWDKVYGRGLNGLAYAEGRQQ